MHVLSAVLEKWAGYEQITAAMKKNQFPIHLTGCVESQNCHLMDCVGRGSSYRLIVTYNEIRAKEIYDDYSYFDRNVYLYPAKDVLFYQADIQGNLIGRQRLEIMKQILSGKPATIVMTIDGLMDKLAPLSTFREEVFVLQNAQTLDFNKVQEKLTYLGYEKMALVDSPGQFAIRGGILDIFPLTEECPYRIELWGEEVDSIRSFDAESQRSIEQVDELYVYPAAEMIIDPARLEKGLDRIEKEYKSAYEILKKNGETEQAFRLKKTVNQIKEELEEFNRACEMESLISYFYEETVSFLDYLPAEDSLIFFDEPARLKERAESFLKEFRESMEGRLSQGYMLPGQAEVLYHFEEIEAMVYSRRSILLSMLMYQLSPGTVKETVHLETKSVATYHNSFEQLMKDLQNYKRKKYRIVILSASTTRSKRLAEDIFKEGLPAVFLPEIDRALVEGEIVVSPGKLKRGFEYPDLRLVVISESDIFSARVRKKKKSGQQKTYSGQKIGSFMELNVGDYVVHEKHGVGIYRGIEQIDVDGTGKDYISIEYKGGSNLFIPATQLDLIQKYASSSSAKPKLNKLGGSEWEKTKTEVRTHIKKVAHDLVELYSIRQSKAGYAYSPDTVWQSEFEELFPYEETEDQLRAIEAVKKDMESTKIMDRLICGDVGYGKTEVAIRAAFKAVSDSKQVVYLVPTTILAQQIYNTFQDRMKDFPIRVEMLSRFVTPAKQKEIIKSLKDGRVDIVIGTHKVLSKKVEYKDLGLLIIDEEQRFGVNHKEQIKDMKKEVDVLSLSATPIPRTLHMSLVGIRDMSVLEEPPVDRRAIQTYVMEYNEEMVREAINRELARGGQVYYVYNRVNNIAQITEKVASLVPDAQVAYAHGQMSERQLEKIMFQFINGELDVLVSTTIIETGLDISNVNTMIIHDANNFGLSQLYQLRGRVGRSNRSAYAFLMYKQNTLLKETAEKRLKAIREFTDLGSGFKIAMRDLEIRGAGNLLGAEQSGRMEAVGYDLYCKMLNDAVLKQKGEAEDENDFETTIDLNVDAYLPGNYVKNEVQKLELYKRIASLSNEEEYDDMMDELIDRYGNIPTAVMNLLQVAVLKSQAHKAYITQVEQKGGEVWLSMYPQAKIAIEKIDPLLKSMRNQLKFKTGESPVFIVNTGKIAKKDLLVYLKNVISEINYLRY
ncbi:MAG: transcription-repair coupling factor [Lachnospiraceae bacterium]|nr:transcription-repair coupling factor [Lachnospiraceae bacterium]